MKKPCENKKMYFFKGCEQYTSKDALDSVKNKVSGFHTSLTGH